MTKPRTSDPRTDILCEVYIGPYTLSEGSETEPLPKGAIGVLTFPVLQEGDRTNRNGRIYPWEILRREGQKIQERIAGRQSVMYDGHSMDGGMYGPSQERKPSEASCLLASLVVDEATALLGPAQIWILDTTKGRDVLGLARAGVPIGASSVGRGSMKPDKYKGRFGEVDGQIINTDFSLERWDVVTDPSVSKARSSSLRENRQEQETTMTLEEMKEKDPKAYDALMETAKAELSEKYDELIVNALTEGEEKIREELKEELSKDLERPIKEQLEAKDTEIAELEEQVEELEAKLQENEKLLKEAGKALKEALGESKKLTEARDEQIQELRESLEKDQAEREMEKARLHIIEATSNNPMSVTIRAMILGPGEKDPKELREEFKSVVAPKNVTEAKAALEQVKRMAKHLGQTTERGYAGKDGGEELKESAGRDRLSTLAGI